MEPFCRGIKRNFAQSGSNRDKLSPLFSSQRPRFVALSRLLESVITIDLLTLKGLEESDGKNVNIDFIYCDYCVVLRFGKLEQYLLQT